MVRLTSLSGPVLGSGPARQLSSTIQSLLLNWFFPLVTHTTAVIVLGNLYPLGQTQLNKQYLIRPHIILTSSGTGGGRPISDGYL